MSDLKSTSCIRRNYLDHLKYALKMCFYWYLKSSDVNFICRYLLRKGIPFNFYFLKVRVQIVGIQVYHQFHSWVRINISLSTQYLSLISFVYKSKYEKERKKEENSLYHIHYDLSSRGYFVQKHLNQFSFLIVLQHS